MVESDITWARLNKSIVTFVNTISSPQKPFVNASDNRIVVLTVGLPGCGKSFFSALLQEHGFIRINQDCLGTRPKCIEAMKTALKSNNSVIIDRTNIDVEQRAHFVKVAREMKVHSVIAVMFDIDVVECAQRIIERKDHPTLPASAGSIAILMSFSGDLVRVSLEEGINQIFYITQQSSIAEVVQQVANALPKI